MHGIDSMITRARRDTIGDAVRRSAARNSEKDAIVFGWRCWSNAGFNAGVNQVAKAAKRTLRPCAESARDGVIRGRQHRQDVWRWGRK